MGLLWLLLRVRWRRSLVSSLVVALVIGVIGGYAMAAASSARRVESSYRTLLADIDAPDLAVAPKCVDLVDENVCLDTEDPQSDALAFERLLAIDIVEQARLFDELLPYFVDADGAPLLATPDNENGCADRDRAVHMVAVGSGGARDQSLPFRLEGDLPLPGSNGVLLTRATAERKGLGIGDTVRLAGWCSWDGDPAELAAVIELQITGLSIGPLDVEPPDTGLAVEPAYVDPVVFEQLASAGAQPQARMLVWLDPRATTQEVAEGLAEFQIEIDLRERANVLDEALVTDARLLWLLAGIGAFGGVLVLAPVIGRNLRDTGPDTATLAALGVQRPQIVQQALIHCCALALIGALAAAVLAVPLGALMPDGLAAAIEPDRNLSFDGLVTAAGVALLIIGVVVLGALPSWRIGNSDRLGVIGESASGTHIVRSLRLRPAARTGVLAAIGTPAGPRRASPWPSLVSMVLVATAGFASVTYLAGLHHLEATASAVGWNWDAMIDFDFEQVDPADVPAILERMRAIDGVEQVTESLQFPPWFPAAPASGVEFIFPWAFEVGPDAIEPTMVSGRAPSGPDEIAIDSVFAEQGGFEVGDVVLLYREALQSMIANELLAQAQDFGVTDLAIDEYDRVPVGASFEITGIAVLPLERQIAIAQAAFTLQGYAEFVEPSADEIVAARAWLPDDLPKDLRAGIEDVFSRLDVDERAGRVFVRFSGDKQAALAELGEVEGVPKIDAPTADEIIMSIGLNLDRQDRVPTSLSITVAAAFALLAGYLLFAAVRARRFELAVMRALGMSTGGILRSIAAQATTTALVALVIAIPAGIAVGRWAWLSYARDLSVLPVSITPWGTLAIASVVAIAMANVAALTLGWSAATRSPGPDLRSE